MSSARERGYDIGDPRFCNSGLAGDKIGRNKKIRAWLCLGRVFVNGDRGRGLLDTTPGESRG